MPQDHICQHPPAWLQGLVWQRVPAGSAPQMPFLTLGLLVECPKAMNVLWSQTLRCQLSAESSMLQRGKRCGALCHMRSFSSSVLGGLMYPGVWVQGKAVGWVRK